MACRTCGTKRKVRVSPVRKSNVITIERRVQQILKSRGNR